MSDQRSKYFIGTLNNPDTYSETPITLKQKLQTLLDTKQIYYAAFQIEVGLKDNTPHIQLYIETTQRQRYSFLQNNLNSHFSLKTVGFYRGKELDEQRKLAKDYVFKTQKDGEAMTVLHPTEVIGEFRDSTPHGNNSWDKLYDDIESGMSFDDVLQNNKSKAVPYFSHIQKSINHQKTKDFTKPRDPNVFKVIYIYGPPATGKSFFINSKHDIQDTYVVSHSNYKDPFFNYSGEPVLVLDEFDGSSDGMPIYEMLKILDFNVYRPNIRYGSVYAGWTTVYIISNLPLSEQYRDHRLNADSKRKALIKAFDSRIHQVLRKDQIDKPFIDVTQSTKDVNSRALNIQINTDIVLEVVTKKDSIKLPDIKPAVPYPIDTITAIASNLADDDIVDPSTLPF